jgi:hypothetical protein
MDALTSTSLTRHKLRHVCSPRDQLDGVVHSWIAAICDKEPLALRLIRISKHRATRRPLASGIRPSTTQFVLDDYFVRFADFIVVTSAALLKGKGRVGRKRVAVLAPLRSSAIDSADPVQDRDLLRRRLADAYPGEQVVSDIMSAANCKIG